MKPKSRTMAAAQVDRVAAVCRQAYWGEEHVMTGVRWKQLDKSNKEDWRKVARASIKAMKGTKR